MNFLTYPCVITKFLIAWEQLSDNPSLRMVPSHFVSLPALQHPWKSWKNYSSDILHLFWRFPILSSSLNNSPGPLLTSESPSRTLFLCSWTTRIKGPGSAFLTKVTFNCVDRQKLLLLVSQSGAKPSIISFLTDHFSAANSNSPVIMALLPFVSPLSLELSEMLYHIRIFLLTYPIVQLKPIEALLDKQTMKLLVFCIPLLLYFQSIKMRTTKFRNDPKNNLCSTPQNMLHFLLWKA